MTLEHKKVTNLDTSIKFKVLDEINDKVSKFSIAMSLE